MKFPRHYLLVLFPLLWSLPASSQQYDSVMVAYAVNDYEAVIRHYEADPILHRTVLDSVDLLDAVTTAYVNIGKYEASKSLLIAAHPHHMPGSLGDALILNNLGLVYDENMRFDSAYLLLNQALQIRKKTLGTDHPMVAESFYNLGSLMAKAGQYDKADEWLTMAMNIEVRHFPPDHLSLAYTYNNLATISVGLGRYDKALDLYNKAGKIVRKHVGEISYLSGILAYIKGKVFLQMEQPDSAGFYLQHSRRILSEVKSDLPESGLIELEWIDQLLRKGRLAEGHAALADLNSRSSQTPETSLSLNPFVKMMTARLLLLENKIDSAQIKAKQALADYLAFASKELPEYALLLETNTSIQFRQKKFREFHSDMTAFHLSMLTELARMFPSFSEKEREQYFNRLAPLFEKYYSLLLLPRPPAGATGQAYNTQLATKAILLNYASRWKRQILESGDLELIKLFTTWQKLSESLKTQYELRKSENPRADSLYDVVNQLEKRLSARSTFFARLVDQKWGTWQEVQGQLKKDEAAIEVIRFRPYNFDSIAFTHGVQYAALIVTATCRQPLLVLLDHQADFEGKHLRAYRNSAIHKIEDNESYDVYWSRIAEKLGRIRKIYFSPDGVYNLINLSTLRNPRTGRYVIDDYNIRLVTNTRELLISQRTELNNTYALLMGGPDFGNRLEPGQATNFDLLTTRLAPGLRGQALTQLPGARKEVEDLHQLLTDQQWTVDLFTAGQATEERLKHSLKPRILHIATHGYFQKDLENTSGQRGSYASLLRSGLMFAGAGGDDDLPPGMEDGILTAYEAMNLNLDNTELVVLSACETGLGEIRNGEGVYGLQRAFRVAGAQALLMSLWKVDDEVTRTLMTNFYTLWLASGNKSDSFRKAQASIRISHPDPYYWGAFVLVGR